MKSQEPIHNTPLTPTTPTYRKVFTTLCEYLDTYIFIDQTSFLSEECFLSTGLVGVDKDAVLTAHEAGDEGTDDAMMNPAASMMATDVGDDADDGGVHEDRVRIDLEQVKRMTATTEEYMWGRIDKSRVNPAAAQDQQTSW